MFLNSSQIVKEIDNATHLDEALALVVKRSRSSMDANACSAYINDMHTDRYMLMAADGLVPASAGKVRVARNEGPVGWVAAHEEAVNLSDALDHPGLRHVPGTGDELFHALSRRPNKPVGVCGEMAGDPAYALLLLGLGVDSLSMNPSSLPRVKWTIRSFAMRQGRELAEKALKIENEFDTPRLLNHALNAAGLGALVREN